MRTIFSKLIDLVYLIVMMIYIRKIGE